jgi:hypothetical protein
VATSACCACVGLLRLQSQLAGETTPKSLGTPHADASSPILLLQLFYSSLFTLSQLQLKPIIHKINFFDSKSIF